MLIRRLLRTWTFLVWLGVIVVVWYFHTREGHFGGMSGAVETLPEDIAPLETARLESLDVEIGQVVTPGQRVAVMSVDLQAMGDVAEIEAGK